MQFTSCACKTRWTFSFFFARIQKYIATTGAMFYSIIALKIMNNSLFWFMHNTISFKPLENNVYYLTILQNFDEYFTDIESEPLSFSLNDFIITNNYFSLWMTLLCHVYKSRLQKCIKWIPKKTKPNTHLWRSRQLKHQSIHHRSACWTDACMLSVLSFTSHRRETKSKGDTSKRCQFFLELFHVRLHCLSTSNHPATDQINVANFYQHWGWGCSC